MKHLLLLLLIMIIPLASWSELISIGEGTVLNQGLPIEPVARYSYSQQLFLAPEIGVGGVIDTLYFHYQVSSQLFKPGNKDIKVYLGHTGRTLMQSWFPVDSLSLVFNDSLTAFNYPNPLPGNGWMRIALSNPFLYDGLQNLILAVDENTPDYGNTSDDFYCSNVSLQRAIQYQNHQINPDPANPPGTGYTLKTHRSNLRLSMQAHHYIPVQPDPLNEANGVSLYPTLSWTSMCDTFDLSFGTHPDSLVILASSIPGNMWQMESPLQYNKHYYWKVTGYYNSQSYLSPIWEFTTVGEAISAPCNLSGYYNGQQVQLTWQAPLTGTAQYYRVYRNSSFYVSTEQSNLNDANVTSGFTYYYYVTAVNPTATESVASNLISVTIPVVQPDLIINQSFEAISAFSVNIPGWSTLDADASLTWAWDTVSFPHEGEAYAWMIFSPQETTPPLLGVSAHSGSKMLMCMSSLNPPNNDWLISPQIHLGQTGTLSFHARSAVSDFGLERLKVLVSTSGTAPTDFAAINPGNYLSVPASWTEYSYNLAVYGGQNIYLAWNCISVDAFALFLDDIKLVSNGGSVGIDDALAPTPNIVNMPNPAHDDFTVKSNEGSTFALEIYDLRGRKLYSQGDLTTFNSKEQNISLASGLYFLRVTQGGSSRMLKQVIVK